MTAAASRRTGARCLERVLVVDDEEHAREEMVYLLESSARVEEVVAVASAAESLHRLGEESFEAVFLDIRMPEMDGLELTRVLRRFARPPSVVFVTAYDEHAVEAFGLEAMDYLLKPVSAERLAKTLDRLLPTQDHLRSQASEPGTEDLPLVAVEVGAKTLLIRRSEIRYVEAAGDYVRLHIQRESYLLRSPISVLEAKWSSRGFIRVHRRFLVNLGHVLEIAPSFNRTLVVQMDTADRVYLPVSRRQARALRERLDLHP